MNLEIEGCESIKELSSAKNATYRSRTIAEEMQQAIADTIHSEIIDDMKKANFIAVMTDESTDISVTGKLIVYVRFVDEEFNVRSHFLGNFNVSEKDAATITDCITKALSERGVSPDKILCLWSDGASVMTGKKSGVAAIPCQHTLHCTQIGIMYKPSCQKNRLHATIQNCSYKSVLLF